MIRAGARDPSTAHEHTPSLNLGGTCDEPFAAVRDAFVENFLAGYEWAPPGR